MLGCNRGWEGADWGTLSMVTGDRLSAAPRNSSSGPKGNSKNPGGLEERAASVG